VPVYNGGRYLEQTIDSILNQTFSDFEIIIVDDCSTDDSVAICRSYQHRDQRIQFYANDKNIGLVENLNKCFTQSKGEWIKPVFQDDYIEVNCLEKMLSVSKLSEVGIALAGRRFIYADNVPAEDVKKNEKRVFLPQLFPSAGYISNIDIASCLISHFGENIIGEPVSVIFHRSIIDEYGLFDKQLC